MKWCSTFNLGCLDDYIVNLLSFWLETPLRHINVMGLLTCVIGGLVSNPLLHLHLNDPSVSTHVPFPQTPLMIEHSSILTQLVPYSSKAYPWQMKTRYAKLTPISRHRQFVHSLESSAKNLFSDDTLFLPDCTCSQIPLWCSCTFRCCRRWEKPNTRSRLQHREHNWEQNSVN